MTSGENFRSRVGNSLGSAVGIFIVYIVASFAILVGFRLVFPGEAPPLGYFSMPWRFMRGLLDFISLFPALVMSSLLIPFGFKADLGEDFARFSPRFIEKIQGPIFAAIIASAVYGLLFFIALPIAQESQSNMRHKGELYRSARERVEIHAAQREWQDASRFLAICENIWPMNPALDQFRQRIAVGVEALRVTSDASPQNAGTGTASGAEGTAKDRAVRDASDALNKARAALAEERYYDAHWLATLSSQLARNGSVEAREATLTASLAWNAVSSLEPGARESHNYSIYHLKRQGYEAMVSKDWIRAYYIFRELVGQTPDDPDAANFFAETQREITGVAFFVDELEASVGENLSGAIFSVPLVPAASAEARAADRRMTAFRGTPGGRVVMRATSLIIYPDYSYAIGLELAAFDENNRPLYQVKAPYAKFIPMTVRGKPRLLILLKALDRHDEKNRWEPEWDGPERSDLGDAQIALDTTYDQFLWLSKARRRVDSLNLADLLSMNRGFGNYGYIPQVFQAEIIHRLAEPLACLPLFILAIIIGWRYRAKTRPRYLGVPMLAIIPLVCQGVVELIQGIFNIIGLWLLLSLGYSLAIGIFIAGSLIIFVLSLIVLATQHG